MTDINYLGIIPLGKINRWTDSKAANITPVTFPGKDAGLTEGVDTLGVTAYFNISGRWTGKFEVIQSYIAQIKSLADGLQTATTKFRSPFVNVTYFTSRSASEVRFGNLATNTSTSASKLIDSSADFVSKNIQVGDLVKNMITGKVAEILTVDSEIQVSLTDYDGDGSDIFPVAGGTGVSYAVTAQFDCKVLSIEARWELPGLSYCDYEISVIQVYGGA